MPNRGDLVATLAEKTHLLAEACRDGMPEDLQRELRPPFPDWLSSEGLSLWVRLIFSALV